MGKVIIISIKPEFVNKIITGEKSIELRKVKPNVSESDIVLIYSTMPVKAIIAYCEVDFILKMAPEILWKTHSKKLGIDKERFSSYYLNCENAVGIGLKSVCKLEKAITLEQVKKHIPNFSPPQTYRYFENRHFLEKKLNITRTKRIL